MISGQKADAGTILFCSKSIKNLYGNSPEFYIGTNISSLVSPALRNFYFNYFKVLADKGDRSFVRHITQGFGCHPKGYAFLVDLYIDFHPFVVENLCFNIIFRPIPTNKEYLLILENGDIENATEKIGKRLGLLPYHKPSMINLINIKSISIELSRINYAFNMIALHEKSKNKIDDPNENRRRSILIENNDFQMDMNEAGELYSVYSTQEKLLELKSLEKNNHYSTFLYNCTVLKKFYGQLCLKVVTLEENTDNEVEENFQNHLANQRNIKSIKTDNQKTDDMVENVFNKVIQSPRKVNTTESENVEPADEYPVGVRNLRTFDNTRRLKLSYPTTGPENTPTHHGITEEQLFIHLNQEYHPLFEHHLLIEH